MSSTVTSAREDVFAAMAAPIVVASVSETFPAELAPEDDVDQRFVASEQGYVYTAAERAEAGFGTEGHGNGAANPLLEIEVLAADTPKGEDRATTDEVQGQDVEQQQVEGVKTVLGCSERQSDANHRGRRDEGDRDLHADDRVEDLAPGGLDDMRLRHERERGGRARRERNQRAQHDVPRGGHRPQQDLRRDGDTRHTLVQQRGDDGGHADADHEQSDELLDQAPEEDVTLAEDRADADRPRGRHERGDAHRPDDDRRTVEQESGGGHYRCGHRHGKVAPGHGGASDGAFLQRGMVVANAPDATLRENWNCLP